MKWVFRLIVTYAGFIVLVFVLDVVAIRFALWPPVKFWFAKPVVAVVVGDGYYTNGIAISDVPLHHPQHVKAVTAAKADEIDRWVFLAENYNDAGPMKVAKDLGLEWPNLTDPDKVVIMRASSVSLVLSWLPLRAITRDFVFLNTQGLDEGKWAMCVGQYIELHVRGSAFEYDDCEALSGIR